MRSKANQQKKTVHQYLIIGGAPKSATTSLFRCLEGHPEVCPANRKETYFFARQFAFNKVFEDSETLESFEKYFSHCDSLDRLRVEATPYTLYSKGAAQKIAVLLPSAKALFILRDPIERLFSDYRFHIQREHPDARDTFEKFIENQLRLSSCVPNLLELGCYIEYLRPFFSTLGRSRVLILFFEEFKANIAAEIRKLCATLGINMELSHSCRLKIHNQTISVRYPWLNRVSIKAEPVVANLRAHAIHHPIVHRVFESIINAGKSAYRALNDDGLRNKEMIPPGVRTQLVDYYRPYNQALSKELRRPLPWKSFQRLK